jgi:hypothetical protein
MSNYDEISMASGFENRRSGLFCGVVFQGCDASDGWVSTEWAKVVEVGGKETEKERKELRG